jgi:flagellar hook-basal body complex protein FliE
MAIESIAGAVAPVVTTGGDAAPVATPGFGASLTKLVSNVESTTADANHAVKNMINGTGDVHDAMIALQRAEMTVQLTVQVRNKLVQAYQDIMRMPV